MKSFVVLYYAPAEATAQMANVTPEQAQEGMKPWMEWMARVGDRLADAGQPLMGGARIDSSGVRPTNTEISGYSIIRADDLESAKALLRDHPHLGWAPGVAIEVYETMPLPGMEAT